jgi:nucleoside-diphosphate-sugar epimerase
MRVFVAGGTGAIGRHLVPALVASGHQVTATTRRPGRLAGLREAGAEPVVLDGLDAVAVGEAVAKAEPEVVIHEMTGIESVSLRHFDQSFAVTSELRTRGLDNLLAAASAAGARRFIAQSYAGWYARTGGWVKTEDDPLDPEPPAGQRATVAAGRYLEATVLGWPGEGVVLRYASLYGPGTADEITGMIRQRRLPVVGGGAGTWSFLHVTDAASATVAAITGAAPGIYNIADDEPAPVATWLPAVAAILGARPPLRVPGWLARPAIGATGLSMMTRLRGASNAKARRELGWTPAWASWRDGFARGL